MNSFALIRLLLLSAPLLFAGCATSQRIVTGAARPAITPDQVRIYAEPPAGAVDIALLNVSTFGDNQLAIDRALGKLRAECAALGANGAVLLGSGVARKHNSGPGVILAGQFIADFDTETADTILKARAVFVPAHD